MFIGSQSYTNLTQDKYEKNNAQSFIVKALRAKNEQKMLKAARENNTLHTREQTCKLSQTSHQKLWKQENNGITSVKS